ncbi:MAG: UDP-N-acetylmuramoyl-L-alanyl-D-glutamate--2,6-diaminopimelate ligase [Oscillospiraceae bacterium]
MLLSALLSGVDVKSNYTDVEVLDIKSNSNDNLLGAVYVCISGVKIDGHMFSKLACEKGAVAVISQMVTGAENELIVEDTRACYAIMCGNFFENKKDSLCLIATTGTNGKTSVSTIIKRLLCGSNVKCGLISTIRAEYGEFTEELPRTTPDAYTLHRLFYDMQKNDITTVSLEASSHALDQKRLENIQFNIAIFTNLTQDHLDYHESMIAYFNAKKKLFLMADYAVINIDDSYGRELIKSLTIPYVTYATTDETADFYADSIICNQDGVKFRLNHNDIKCKVSFAIPGIYSVQNALAAIAACVKFGMSIESIVLGLAQMPGIMGRSELIKTGKGFSVICDYAHTPDGLINILKSTRQYAKGKIILLFGCGGDRDKEKRAIMGSIATELADFSIVTSDNPRTENPSDIINDILCGMAHDKEYIAILDRRDAIRYAIATANKGDIIILAGKGHEQYQILGDKKLQFDERKLVRGILKSLG